jgi:hypothetical protein
MYLARDKVYYPGASGALPWSRVERSSLQVNTKIANCLKFLVRFRKPHHARHYSRNSFSVAPLVLLSAADHYGRSAKGTRKRVVGVLLGQNDGKNVRVSNSFAGMLEAAADNC